jgi:hypothetical protein
MRDACYSLILDFTGPTCPLRSTAMWLSDRVLERPGCRDYSVSIQLLDGFVTQKRRDLKMNWLESCGPRFRVAESHPEERWANSDLNARA